MSGSNLQLPQSLGARLRGLKQERTELHAQLSAIFEAAAGQNRDLNDGERAKDDELSARVLKLDDEIARYERMAAAPSGQAAFIGAPAHPRQGEGAAAFGSFGQFLQAVAVASDPRAAHLFGGSSSRELMDRLTSYEAAATGMGVGSPSGGGHLVRNDWSTDMLRRGSEQAIILPRCRSIPIGADFDGLEYPFVDESSRATGSRWGGVRVYRKAEAGTVAASQPKIGKGELKLEEMMGIAYATERLLRDATALQGLLTSAFESEFAFKIDDEIVRGSGVGMCLGFFNTATGAPFVSVAKETSQTAATVNVANVLKMYARMPARLKPGAAWFIHSDVMTQLPQMTIGQMPVWLPPGGLVNNSPFGTLLGKPIYEIEQCEALGTQGDIFFANMNEYAVITKASEGIRADASMHVRFIYDEMTFRWVYRINGQPTWRTSLTMYKGSSAQAPFVGLDTRS